MMIKGHAHPSQIAAKDRAPGVVGMVRVLKAQGAPPAACLNFPNSSRQPGIRADVLFCSAI